jgi:hypothetical protein
MSWRRKTRSSNVTAINVTAIKDEIEQRHRNLHRNPILVRPPLNAPQMTAETGWLAFWRSTGESQRLANLLAVVEDVTLRGFQHRACHFERLGDAAVGAPAQKEADVDSPAFDGDLGRVTPTSAAARRLLPDQTDRIWVAVVA